MRLDEGLSTEHPRTDLMHMNADYGALALEAALAVMSDAVRDANGAGRGALRCGQEVRRDDPRIRRERMRGLLSTCAGRARDADDSASCLSPLAGAGEVVVAVKACAINYPDVLVIEDKYQFKPPRPFAPGGEVSGVVESVGEGVDPLQGGRPGDGQHRDGRAGREAS